MFKILKPIQTILQNDTAVVALLGDNIFPNIVPDKSAGGRNIDLPAAVLVRSLTPQSVKVCNLFNTNLEVMIYSLNYYNAVNIAEAVYNALNNFSGEVDGIRIDKMLFSEGGEGFIDGAYLQRLVFTIR